MNPIVNCTSGDLKTSQVLRQFEVLGLGQAQLQLDNGFGLDEDRVTREVGADGEVAVPVSVDVAWLRDREPETLGLSSKVSGTYFLGQAEAFGAPGVDVDRALAVFVRCTDGDVRVAIVVQVAEADHRSPEATELGSSVDVMTPELCLKVFNGTL